MSWITERIMKRGRGSKGKGRRGGMGQKDIWKEKKKRKKERLPNR